MNDNQTIRRSRQRGYSLIEILVAMTIFTTVVLAALLLYDRSNKVFKQSMESSDMQQSTRVAFDKLVADLRMTGFDFDRDGTPFGALAGGWEKDTTYTSGMIVQPTDPNGHTYVVVKSGTSDSTEPTWPTGANEQVTDGDVIWQEDGMLQYQQPDEQIEYAGAHAVAIRGNFNFETATGPCATGATTPCENGREPELQTSIFPVVTTANNEILIYALKPKAWAAGEDGDDLVFYADITIPRSVHPGTDEVEETITIPDVELCDKGCNSPPYTLYRFTLDENGDPDAGTPVAENIRSMTFRYFKTTTATDADELTKPYPEGAGPYDGGDPYAVVAGRNARASIRAMELALMGMNPEPDKDYTDPDDAVAPHYRKLELKSLIVPRNIGRRGMKEYNTEKPQQAEIKSYCTGACNAVFLTWSPPTGGGDIDSFAILYDPDPCQGTDPPTGGFQYSEEVGLNLSGSVGRYIEPGQTWSFAVQSINKFGAETSDCVGMVLVQNTTKPAALTALHATGGLELTDYPLEKNQVTLYFPPAVDNVDGQDTLSCDTGALTQSEMPPSEKRYYEIMRGTTEMFDPSVAATTTIRVLDAGSATQPGISGALMRWVDATTANCQDYWYRIRVVDYCARNAAWNVPAGTAQATSDWYPAVGAKAIKGRAENTTGGVRPLAPVLTLENKVCAGASSNCTLTFSWSAVKKNTADEAITVDKYTLNIYEWTGGTWPANPTDTKVLTGGLLNTTYDVSASGLFKFTVEAEDCAVSDPSNELIYPCVFAGGTLTATIPSGSVYDGTGTSADPYVVEGPTLDVATSVAVKELKVSVFDVGDGSQVGTTLTASNGTGTLSSASFSLPQTPDGRVSRVLVTATDTAGCTKNTDLYIIDQAAGGCSITDMGSDSSLLTVGKDFVTFTLENQSANDITLKKAIFTYAVTNNMKGLTSVTFGSNTVAVNCSSSTAIVTAPAGTVVPGDDPLDATDPFTLTMTANLNVGNLQGNNPITKVCLVYQTVTGDLLQCQIAPTAATCTEPSGAACQ